MSEKKRRDITLGEMQDECKRFESPLCGGKACAYVDLCNQMKSGYTPHAWDLSDPPRFNEAQMALLKALYGIGVNKIQSGAAFDGIYLYTNDLINNAGLIYSGKIGTSIKLEDGETLDLAELLGKDDAET